MIFFDVLSAVTEKLNINLNKNSTIKFLDIGAGVGQKVFLANKLFGFESHGIELRKPIAESAKKMLRGVYGGKFGEIFNENALTFPNYDKYDIIYFYVPIADGRLEKEMEFLVAKNAKKGAIVIGFSALVFNKSYEESNKLKKLGWKPIFNDADGIKSYNSSCCWQKQ